MAPELPSRLTAAGIAVASTVVLGLGAWLLVDAGAEIEGTGQGPMTVADRPTIAPASTPATASATPSASPSPTASLSPSEAETESEEPVVEPQPVVEEPQPQVSEGETRTGGGSAGGDSGGDGTGGGTGGGNGGGFVPPGGGTGPDTSTEGEPSDPVPPGQDAEAGTAG